MCNVGVVAVVYLHGRVWRILEIYEDRSRSHWVVYSARRNIQGRVRAAVAHLLDRLED